MQAATAARVANLIRSVISLSGKTLEILAPVCGCNDSPIERMRPRTRAALQTGCRAVVPGGARAYPACRRDERRRQGKSAGSGQSSRAGSLPISHRFSRGSTHQVIQQTKKIIRSRTPGAQCIAAMRWIRRRGAGHRCQAQRGDQSDFHVTDFRTRGAVK